ncbi:MAG: thermonuclease family protein [Euryarchaeota archaeon]|nr:thermonuclease family protein [Euryarchaeota archaeon]
MRLKLVLVLMSVVVLVAVAGGYPTEASGTVTNIVDGDTFDVEIEQSDRDLEDIIRVKLADVDSPETSGDRACQAGRDATNFTRTTLADEWVHLDLDDKTGPDRYGSWVCVVYLQNVTEDGQAPEPVYPCFNRMIVDAGHAMLCDSTNNEFDPLSWWLDTDDVPVIDDFWLDIIYDQISEYDGVQDAAIVQDNATLSLALIVDYGTSESYAKELGESFVRLTKSFSPDVGPKNEIGPGIYNYLIGVFRPDGTKIVLGAKVSFARRITW